MPSYTDNAYRIKDTLSSALSAATPQETKRLLKEFTGKLAAYLDELEAFYIKLEDNLRLTELEYAGMDDVSDVTVSYSLFKKLQYSDDEIETLLKTGYVLIDEIRYLLTNERITYQIGIPNRGQLYEKTIGMEELLKYTRVEYNTRSKINNLFKLRMYNKGELKQSMLDDEHKVEAATEGSSTIWSTIARFVSDNKNDTRYKNKGNAYEVYRVLYARNSNQNRIPPAEVTVSQIADTFAEVRANTASSTKGGDYLTSQIKYFASAPSIITTSLVRTTLNDVLQIFNKYIANMDSGAFEQSLKQLFLKDPAMGEISDDIELQARDLAEEHLINITRALNLQVTKT